MPVGPDGADPGVGPAGGRSGDLAVRRRSSGAPWNRRARRRDSRKPPNGLNLHPRRSASRHRPPGARQNASPCRPDTLPDRAKAPPERAWTTVGPAIGGHPGRLLPSGLDPVGTALATFPGSPTSASTDRRGSIHDEISTSGGIGPRARFIFGSLGGNEPDNSCATSSNNSRPYHSRPPPCKWHPADV